MTDSTSLPVEIQRYLAATADPLPDDTPIERLRFVALDCETTGTDATKDAIISMGAIAVIDGEIRLEEEFEALLKIRHNTSSVVVHGITAEEAARKGVYVEEALTRFLDYLGNAVIVGHHIGFDVEVIQRACLRNFGIELNNRWIDTMELTLHLDDVGAIEAMRRSVGGTASPFQDFSLDGLCRRFRIAPHDRHTAAGDAFITAQIFLKLLRLAQRHDRTTLGALAERWVDPRDTEEAGGGSQK
ncbi:3'-5' exonuclease [Synoicihabitans lomoniglobus]|uniref:3'-5' exonuclease n=1 Tax=Synoicihabitans lomoniglobus TaxID=2909285 RepID=A0AAF0CPJ8_9BACT|nr:3'-5' exonuclease [Opitutaceae bacterium LMO-M01]WED65119.1 3'-5' exonuclease [Opitutaceae bacterium LMO-M01]